MTPAGPWLRSPPQRARGGRALLRNSKRSPRAAAAALLALAAAAGPARANGRFPQANQPVLHPGDPARLAVRTTFGALASADGGRSFRWICESVAGYGGVQDPALALFGGASIAFAAEEGLLVSADGGCSFARAPALPAAPARDLTLDRGRPASVAALVTPAAGPAEVFVSDDGARSWRPVGPPLPAGFEAEALELAGARLYVSGASGPANARRGLVARLAGGESGAGGAGGSSGAGGASGSSGAGGAGGSSGAGGASGSSGAGGASGTTWIITEVPLEGEASLYLAALDPSNAERVYARADGAAADRLLVSEDGARSFRTVLRSEGRLLGFALSPDGAKVAAGGPGVGVLVAARSDFVFQKKSSAGALGLAWGPAGLFAAANDFAEGYVLARSVDEGASFEPLLASFARIAGPLEGCPAGGAYERTCATEWPALRRELGGDEGGSGGGGAGGAAAGAGGSAAAAGGAPAAASRDGGCSSGGPPKAPLALLAGALLVGAGLGRARRRRRERA